MKLLQDNYVSKSLEDDKETKSVIDDFYKSHELRHAIDYGNLENFLFLRLQTLGKSLEVTRPIQIYWTVTPLILCYKLQNKPFDEKFFSYKKLIVSSLEQDFTQRPFQHQHIMNVMGQCLVMRQLQLEFSQEQLKTLQSLLIAFYHSSGAFRSTFNGEYDCRTTYAAIVVYNSLKLNNFDTQHIDNMMQKAAQFLVNQFKSGFGMAESHLAYTFCAVAGLRILEKIQHKQYVNDDMTEKIIDFTINRQTEFGGFNGRPNKHVDGCYTYWAIATIKLLGIQYLELIQREDLLKFCVNCCQEDDGFGLRDKPDVLPDSYHSCYVLGGLWVLSGGNAEELGIE